MTTKLHITEIEAYDELKELLFTIKCFDECSVEVTLKQTCHTAQSWQEMAEDIARAIKMMGLEGSAS